MARASALGLHRRDIIEPAIYGRLRARYLGLMVALRQSRRARLSPDVGILFENRETVLCQIHEVLFHEGYAPARVSGEIDNYAYLLPPPGELRATVMVDGGSHRRGRQLTEDLRRPGALELSCGGVTIGSELAEADDRHEGDAVQYLRWSGAEALRSSLERASSGAQMVFHDRERDFITAVSRGLCEQLAQDLRGPMPGPSLLHMLVSRPVFTSPGRAASRRR